MNKLYQTLEQEIIKSYEESVTLEEAERLAGKFLHAQMQVSTELRKVDLDSRMRKSGLKAVKAAVYMDIVSKAEKRPTEAALEHILNSDPLVNKEQNGFDDAETLRFELERIFGIFKEAHHYFKQISRGSIS